jgi:hypothetical protein
MTVLVILGLLSNQERAWEVENGSKDLRGYAALGMASRYG